MKIWIATFGFLVGCLSAGALSVIALAWIAGYLTLKLGVSGLIGFLVLLISAVVATIRVLGSDA